MNDNVHAWPKPAGRADAPLPKPIVRPCDWGLKGAINTLETQLGTIEAYNRLVSASRMNSKPTSWNVSLGWDKDKRDVVIKRAANAGLLSAPILKNLLPNYSGTEAEQEAKYPEGLRRLKEELAKMQLATYESGMQHAREVEEARQAELRKKEEIAAQVAAYQSMANKAA